MRLSEVGAERIANYEGFVPTAYWDIDHWSIGYGTHARSKSEGPISREEARERLRRHADRYVGRPLRAALAAAGFTLNQNQFDAAVSLGYNLGSGVFGTGWAFGKALADGDVKEMAEAFLLYDKAGGVVLAGLTRRRKEERGLFLRIAYTDTELHELLILRDPKASKTARKRMAFSLKRQAAEIQKKARAEKDGWQKFDRARRFQGIRRALKKYGYL